MKLKNEIKKVSAYNSINALFQFSEKL